MGDNKGCPYRDKNWKMCSKEEAVYVLYEPNKDRDIERNKEQAEVANRQSIQKVEPADLRDRNIGTVMNKDYKSIANDCYNKANAYIKNHTSEIHRLNLDNEKAVVDKARSLVDNKGVCYGTSAGVAAILDERKIGYKVYSGVAEIRRSNSKTPTIEQLKKFGSSHVWVEADNGKTYEWFSGKNSNEIIHYSITDEIIFKKRK